MPLILFCSCFPKTGKLEISGLLFKLCLNFFYLVSLNGFFGSEGKNFIHYSNRVGSNEK